MDIYEPKYLNFSGEKADFIRLGTSMFPPRISPREVEKKPGRNEKCSCGSGTKFKKCCGNK